MEDLIIVIFARLILLFFGFLLIFLGLSSFIGDISITQILIYSLGLTSIVWGVFIVLNALISFFYTTDDLKKIIKD